MHQELLQHQVLLETLIGNVSGNLTVGGVLTYEDVTNVDSIGIITARSDIHVGAGVSAVGVQENIW